MGGFRRSKDVGAVVMMAAIAQEGTHRYVRKYKYTCVKALVRWATGKRLINRLPKLSLIKLSPPLNRGILGLRMGPYVPTPRLFYISGDPGRAIHQILDMRRYTFL